MLELDDLVAPERLRRLKRDSEIRVRLIGDQLCCNPFGLKLATALDQVCQHPACDRIDRRWLLVDEAREVLEAMLLNQDTEGHARRTVREHKPCLIRLSDPLRQRRRIEPVAVGSEVLADRLLGDPLIREADKLLVPLCPNRDNANALQEIERRDRTVRIDERGSSLRDGVLVNTRLELLRE